MSDAAVLFSPLDLGGISLANRIVMAPLRRNRATRGSDAPRELNAEYYAQRASAGLIVSESTQISQQGKGYAWTPGIYTRSQLEGWRRVTEAVHERGGKIVLQLWHAGRISHPALQPHRALPVAPSAIAPIDVRTFTDDGAHVFAGLPRALQLSELPGILDDYRRAGENALSAGFDGVEIQAANGYLLHQFLSAETNQRTDAYGGSPENRLRFPLEVAAAVAAVAGAERTGIRISPVSPRQSMSDSEPAAVFFPFVRELDRLGLAYVHVVEGATQGERDFKGFDFAGLRKLFRGAWMVNNGYTRAMAIDAIASGTADLVAFGRPFIANPDLVERLRLDAELAIPDRTTFYGGDAHGYTDYPALEPASSL